MPNINDLRDHLFETLEALRAEKNPMNVDRAHAIAHVSQTIINTGRLECDYMELLGGTGTGFCPEEEPMDPSLPSTNGAKLLPRRR